MAAGTSGPRMLVVTTMLIALVAAACNGENPLAIDDLVDDEQLGECPELLSAIREEASAEVGPYGLGQSGPFGFDEMQPGLGLPFEVASGSRVDGPRAGLADRPGGDVDEDLLVVVSDGRLYVVDAAGPGVIGSVGLGARSVFEFGSVSDRSTTATLHVSGTTASVVFPQVSDPPEELRLTTDPFGGTAAGAVVRVDLTDPARPAVVETLYLGGAITQVSPSDEIGLGVDDAEPQLSLGVLGAAPPLPLVRPVNRAAEDMAEAANRQVVAESVLEDWVPHYALARGGAVVASGPASGCTLQRIPDSSLGSATALAVRLPAQGELTALDAVSIVGAHSVTVAGDYVLAGGSNEFPGLDYHGFHWTEEGVTGAGRVRVGEMLDASPLAVGDGQALGRAVDWNRGMGEIETVLFDASERGLRMETIGTSPATGGQRPLNVAREGDSVALLRDDGVAVLAVTPDGRVAESGSVELGSMAGRLQPLGGGRVLFTGSVDGKGHVIVLDVSDPASPAVQSRSEISWVAEGPGFGSIYDAESGTLVVPRMQVGSIAGTLQVLSETDGGFDPVGIVPFESDPPRGVGDTDCEEIGLDQIENQLEMFGQGGSINVLCIEPGATGVAGHACSSVSGVTLDPALLEQFGIDAGGPQPDQDLEEIQQAVADGARIESCRPWDFDRGITPDFMAMVDGRVLAVAGPQVRVGDVDGFELIDTINLQAPS